MRNDSIGFDCWFVDLQLSNECSKCFGNDVLVLIDHISSEDVEDMFANVLFVLFDELKAVGVIVELILHHRLNDFTLTVLQSDFSMRQFSLLDLHVVSLDQYLFGVVERVELDFLRTVVFGER